MSDTNPLPVQELRTAEDARYKRLQVALYAHRHEAFITCPESCWCWEVDAVLTEHEAARAASPVTLEEALMVNEALTWHEYMKPKDASDPERAKRANDAWFARTEHARRLAGEGGGQ